MGKKYWEEEEPIVVDTGENVLRLFEKARKLQVSRAYWTDKSGEKRHGQTVSLDIEAVLKSPEAVDLFKTFLG
jgi:hypothetical protein